MTMNKYINNIVNPSDHICATLECAGRRLASINGMNLNSLDAIRRALLDLPAVLLVWRSSLCATAPRVGAT